MKQSELFTRTSRSVSSDEASLNARLLQQGGFISRELAGVYNFLPPGLRVLNKIISIIREEMNSIGGQEIMMSALQGQAAWEASRRWDDDEMDIWFKTSLKNGSMLGLAPTHEEPLTVLMKQFIHSYRDLPAFPYQFQTKFRNEKRAKAGILRAREFIMKDLYSFCRNSSELDEFYEEAKKAYSRIFSRLGLGGITYLTLAGGGTFSKFSHEFQTVCANGEDTVYIHGKDRIGINKEIFTDEILKEFNYKREDFASEKTIEVGNIFKLGTKFSEALGLNYADENDCRKPVVMGSYGIGPARVMGTVVETYNDENGIIWPPGIAPYSVHLLSLGGNETVMKKSAELYEKIGRSGLEVLWDNRTDVHPGMKFSDADLIGCPLRLVVSQKTLKNGKAEIRHRSDGKTVFIDDSLVINYLMENLPE